MYAIYLADEGEQMPSEISFAGINLKGKSMKVLGHESLVSCSFAGETTTIKIPEKTRASLAGKHAWVFKFK